MVKVSEWTTIRTLRAKGVSMYKRGFYKGLLEAREGVLSPVG